MKSLIAMLGLTVLLVHPAFGGPVDGPGTGSTFGHAWQHVTFVPTDGDQVESFTSKIAFPTVKAFSLELREALDRQGAPPQKAYVYSDAFVLRRRIHKYASFATGPLFVAQYLVGKKLYDGDESGGVRDAHSILAAGVGLLFGINTVTGAWNLWEGRKDPNGRGKRVVHSLLMLAADAGFLATSATAPEGRGEDDGDRSLHRNVAIVSFGSAGAGYLLMLLAR